MLSPTRTTSLHRTMAMTNPFANTRCWRASTHRWAWLWSLQTMIVGRSKPSSASLEASCRASKPYYQKIMFKHTNQSRTPFML